MTTKKDTKEYTIDANGKALGRVATEVVKLLRGKNDTNFTNHLAPNVKVTIINASKLDVSPKKLKEKIYRHYTGHPGGLREKKMADLIANKGWSEPIKKAVYGMLPDNRLRAVMMKNLIITE